MSKWLNQYLQKFHTDNTDKEQKLSALSVPTLHINENMVKDKLYIAGGNLITTTTTIANFPDTNNVSTDNTDKSWGELVKKSIDDQKAFINIIEDFLLEFEKAGLRLLPEDKRWLRKICVGVSGSRLKSLMEQYSYYWRTSMMKEALPQKQENAGRFTANTFLREAFFTSGLDIYFSILHHGFDMVAVHPFTSL